MGLDIGLDCNPNYGAGAASIYRREEVRRSREQHTALRPERVTAYLASARFRNILAHRDTEQVEHLNRETERERNGGPRAPEFDRLHQGCISGLEAACSFAKARNPRTTSRRALADSSSRVSPRNTPRSPPLRRALAANQLMGSCAARPPGSLA